MATATFTPVEDYLAKTWRPDREYIDGEVCERNLGEYEHASLQTVLAARLFFRRREWNIRVVVEQRVQVSRTHFRVPDVAILSADLQIESIITHPPLACIEILSKDDTLASMRDRVADYSAMGVPNIWLFDPERREAWTCTLDSMIKVTGDLLSASGSEIIIPLAEIWADLD
jgi:Uma2 family endonuclease